VDTPQSPEVEVINPRERAWAHKAESVGVVALSTVRLGESQFKVIGTPPSEMVRLARGGKGAEGVANKSRVAAPERMEEKRGGVKGERRVDKAMLSIASIAGRQDGRKVEFHGVKESEDMEEMVLLVFPTENAVELHSPLSRSRANSGSVHLVPAGKPAMPVNKEGLLRLPLTMADSLVAKEGRSVKGEVIMVEDL